MKYSFRKQIIIFSLLLVGHVSQGQVIGTIFPEMETVTAEDREVILPEGVKGKFTLLGLAYSKKSESDLKTWFSPIYNTFIKENKGLFASFAYDVNVFFIPMFTGIKAAGMGAARKQAVKRMDPKLLPNILFFKGKLKEYKKDLAFEKKDVPYFFVLDENGKIVYATSGKFTSKKMDEIEKVLE